MSSKDIKLASRVICTELKRKSDLYDGFVASVEGVIRENGVIFLPFDKLDEKTLAIAIVDRIAGLK